MTRRLCTTACLQAGLLTPLLHVQPESVEGLEAEVAAACARVDARLKGLLLERFGFVQHCAAMKRLLFLAQGDFASALIHHTADLLPQRVSSVRNL